MLAEPLTTRHCPNSCFGLRRKVCGTRTPFPWPSEAERSNWGEGGGKGDWRWGGCSPIALLFLDLGLTLQIAWRRCWLQRAFLL